LLPRCCSKGGVPYTARGPKTPTTESLFVFTTEKHFSIRISAAGGLLSFCYSFSVVDALMALDVQLAVFGDGVTAHARAMLVVENKNDGWFIRVQVALK
jgi:hypothetical protein